MTLGKVEVSILAAAALCAVYVADSHASEQDKVQHFTVSAILGLAASSFVQETEHPVLYATAMATLPGVAKEFYDAHHPASHTSDMGDLGADIAGAAAGASVGYHLFIHASKGNVIIGIQGELP